jgi:hypothetical protein
MDAPPTEMLADVTGGEEQRPRIALGFPKQRQRVRPPDRLAP